MSYINTTTGERYTDGRSLTVYHDGVLFTGIPSEEQLEQWGYTLYVPPTQPEPTQDELRAARMNEIQSELQATDYIVLKKAEGIDISSYDALYNGDFLAWRQGLRDEYNQLEQGGQGND